MTRALILLAAAVTSSAALADPDTDYPHRDWGQVATLDMSAADATNCIARTLDRRGSVLILPVEGGSDIDYTVDVAWGQTLEPWERYKVRTENGVTTLRVFYRHPVSREGVGKDVRRLEKRCLKIKRIEPVSR